MLLTRKQLSPEAQKYMNALLQAKEKIKQSFMDIAKTLYEAKQELSNEDFKQLLKDKRINLKETQVNKLISIYNVYQKAIPQSTELINIQGVEKAYLLSSIADNDKRTEMEKELISNKITVKKLGKIVDKINDDNLPPKDAIDEVEAEIQNMKNKPKDKILAEDYRKLKEEYDKILNENKELKLKLKQYNN